MKALSDGRRHTLQELGEMLGTCSTSAGCQISRLRYLGVPILDEWAAEDGRYFKRYWIGNGKEQQQ